MKRVFLLLVIGLLAVGASAFATENVDPIVAALLEPVQDPYTLTFSQDLPQPLEKNSKESIKLEFLGDFLTDRPENPSVFGEVTSFAKSTIKGTYNMISKPTVLLFDGLRSVIEHIPGTGPDAQPENIETVDMPGAPTLEFKENRPTFFEREFAKQLATHRTAQDFNDPAEEELRNKKVKFLKIMLLQMDFVSDK